jgi:hypothetical protein
LAEMGGKEWGRQWRKIFTLQTIELMAKQEIVSGCAAKVADFSLHAGVIMSNA